MDDTSINIVEEITWGQAFKKGGMMYGILGVALLVVSIISTSITCSKQNFWASFLLAIEWAMIPAIITIISSKYTFIRQPFSNVLESFGVTPERASTFGSAYLILLVLLPVTVYVVHSAENSACVASTSEMTSFKQKMLKELQEKQEAEEKNEKKK